MSLFSAAICRRRFLTQLLSAALLPAAGDGIWRTASPQPGTPTSAEPAPGTPPGTDRRHYTLIGVL